MRKGASIYAKRHDGDSVKRRPEDEALLFRESMRDVKRLPASREHAGRVKPAPRARLSRARVSDIGGVQPISQASLEPEDAVRFVRAGMPRSVLRELRRGRRRPQAVLDLHGMSILAAERALREFLEESLTCGRDCVRIVHGKGLHSRGPGPVLRRLVDATLRSTGQVRAFVSAGPAHGGTGAVNVLLDR
jgi:DNA-nicking Smr family endonuclease